MVLTDVKSKISNDTSGIPQVSVPGPILFFVYINDMPEVVDKDTILYLFADETQCIQRHKILANHYPTTVRHQ